MVTAHIAGFRSSKQRAVRPVRAAVASVRGADVAETRIHTEPQANVVGKPAAGSGRGGSFTAGLAATNQLCCCTRAILRSATSVHCSNRHRHLGAHVRRWCWCCHTFGHQSAYAVRIARLSRQHRQSDFPNIDAGLWQPHAISTRCTVSTTYGSHCSWWSEVSWYAS